MPKLPVISGEELAKLLISKGYSIRSRKGSHVNLVHGSKLPITVPLHKELKRGLLRHILKQAGIEPEEIK